MTALKIPYDQLNTETIHGVIEEFVTLDGTGYGEIEVSLKTKISQVLGQLKSGKAVSVRMDADLKNNAEGILSSLGLTASQAINVFYKKITFRNGLPFPVEIPQKKLNEIAKKAMEEKKLDEYKTSSELYEELGI